MRSAGCATRSHGGARDIRIGLTPGDFLSWQGGRELFALLAETLEESLEPGDTLSLVGGIESHSAVRRLASRVRAGAADLAKGRMPARMSSSAAPAGPDIAASPYRPGEFDVIGPLISPPHNISDPWVGYIPDVQHRRLPDMFSARERAERDRRFRSVLNKARVVIVNAAEVANDLRQFYPQGRANIVALPFAACAGPDWFTDGLDVRARYNLRGDFFLCSNQFWKHKNHAVVLDAVALAKDRGTPLHFVLTGDTSDYRHPEYFPGLLDRMRVLGIEDHMSLLGFIPKADQIQLIRAARAVVQPSLFEGSPGGGAIYNAIALGRPTIVSDLPVNREITGLVTHYFDPANPEALLEKLLIVQAAAPVITSKGDLLREGDERRSMFGKAVRQAFAEACQA